MAQKYQSKKAVENEAKKIGQAKNMEELKQLEDKIKKPENKSLLYLKIGELYSAEKKYNEALAYYKKAADSSTTKIAQKSQYLLIELLFAKENYLKAYNESITYIYLFQQEKKSEKILFIAAKSALKSGKKSDYQKFKKDLARDFPNSSYLKDL